MRRRSEGRLNPLESNSSKGTEAVRACGFENRGVQVEKLEKNFESDCRTVGKVGL